MRPSTESPMIFLVCSFLWSSKLTQSCLFDWRCVPDALWLVGFDDAQVGWLQGLYLLALLQTAFLLPFHLEEKVDFNRVGKIPNIHGNLKFFHFLYMFNGNFHKIINERTRYEYFLWREKNRSYLEVKFWSLCPSKGDYFLYKVWEWIGKRLCLCVLNLQIIMAINDYLLLYQSINTPQPGLSQFPFWFVHYLMSFESLLFV